MAAEGRVRVPVGMKRILSAMACIGLAAGAAGCTPARILGLHPARPAGPIAVAIGVPSQALEPAPGQAPPALVRVSLVKDAHVLVQERPVASGPAPGDPTFAFTFERVYEGRWEVAGELVDAEGDVTYSGSVRLYVAPGQATTVDLRLAARPATLRVRIDLSGYDRAAAVSAAGVKLAASTTAYLRESRPGTALAWEFDRQRAAGTYDLQVLLYDPEGCVEFSSERTTVALWPGKVTAVEWRPAAGGPVVIVGFVDWIPGAPAGVTCTPLPQERQVEVSWQPPADADLAGYRLYLRPPDGFLRLKQELPPGTTRARLADAELPWETGGTAHVAVGAVDLAGQAGLLAEAECLFAP